MEISEISVKNIKGFGDPTQTIKLDNSIKSNKVNLLVAPNGWGKSSLTSAFESLKTTKLDVEKDYKHKQDETLNSVLSLVIDGHKYEADETKNEILEKLICKVIHCDTYPVAVTKNMGKFSSSKGYIGIRAIEICRIPTCPKLSYKYTDEKKGFGTNGKLLANLELYFKEGSFIDKISEEVFEKCSKLGGTKAKKLLDDVRTYVNLKKGTVDSIKSTIDTSMFDGLSRNENYAFLRNLFCPMKNELDSFTDIYQICSFICKNGKRNIKAVQKYLDYIRFKIRMDQNIKSVDTTWKNIKCIEEDGALLVEFPNADLISNGQRDILTFTIHLQEFKAKLQLGKKYFLLIDEVFDYLDDANILAAQYYLTDLLRYAKDNQIELILGLFTHLDPQYFRSYSFNKKILNVCYLKDVEAKASEELKAFIAFRQTLNHKDPGRDKDLWGKLSKYCFHYHKDFPSFKNDVIPYHKPNVRETWCEGNGLFVYILDELNKYLSDNSEYDPYAVSLAIRIGTEKKVYEQFENEGDKNTFMNVRNKGTKDKIEFAESKNILIPDAYHILSLIHGESDHIEWDEAHQKFNEKPVVYKLNNAVIKHMVALLFDYVEGTPVPMNKLH